MDIISFVKINDLWRVDMPEFNVTHITYKVPNFITERNMIDLLDTLAMKKSANLHLEFHYEYINPYDAKMVKTRNTYKCVSIFYKEKDMLLSFPPILERAMKGNQMSLNIYIRISRET